MKTEENPQPDETPQSSSFVARTEPARDREISEDEALARLSARDLGAEALAAIARTRMARKSRKVQFALLLHPRAPRHVLFPLLRGMFTFDLMKVALTPQIAADLKRRAEEQILLRLESLTVGERISLARRASARVVAGLVADSEQRVVSAALANPHLRAASLRAALMSPNATLILFELVSEHRIWSQNRELQIALVANEKTPIEAVERLAKYFSPQSLEDLLPPSRRGQI